MLKIQTPLCQVLASKYTHVFDTARHCQRANLTPRGAVHPIQTNWRERGREVLCRPHLSRGGGHVLGATPPDPGPKYRPVSSSTIHFNHCSTVTVNLEPTPQHSPTTLTLLNLNLEQWQQCCAPLFFDPFYWRRGPILKLEA